MSQHLPYMYMYIHNLQQQHKKHGDIEVLNSWIYSRSFFWNVEVLKLGGGVLEETKDDIRRSSGQVHEQGDQD